jgi:hypothetical protein
MAFSILSVLLSACSPYDRTPTHVDVVVLDGHGVPLTNKKVNLYAILNGRDYSATNSTSNIAATATSDKDGKLAFDYTWESDESSTTFFHVVPVDDSLYKGVSYASIPIPDNSLSEVKHNVNVVLDKIVPFKIRLKSKRNDVLTNTTNIKFEGSVGGNTKLIERELHSSGGSGNVPAALDKTFTAMAFEKNVCNIQTIFTFASEPKSVVNNFKIDLRTFRDSVYLISF